ncbi:MAG: amino acid adenylation domain-containing protein, partial [Xenococcaceae cyanobacterium]
MKTIEEFVSDLRRRDINLWLDGNDLCYKAPSKTLTPDLRQELKERKAEILTFLHNANTATHSNLSPILPVPQDKDLPLSFAQQRLWFLGQLEPGSSAYNMPAVYRLTGQLNITVLEQSLNEIIRRHEVLRTTFPAVDGQPSQAIAPSVTLTLPTIDLREHPETEREAIAQQLANEEAQQPFNLATGPLFRVKPLRLAGAEYVLLLNMHHIISDGWSFDIFFRELEALYTAFSNDQPSPLPELPIQYADFAYWQRQWLQGEVLESQLNYWKQQLSGSLPLLQLPTDYPRPPIQTYQGAYQSLELSLDLTEALKTLSQQEGATLFTTLLAAFQTLLSRYSGQEDIIIGTPVAGRNQVETEGLIGFFINSLAIRTNLSGNPSFRQLLSQVREVTLGAYDHQDLPLEKLIEELNPERDLSRSPLFQVMFAFQNTPSQPRELLGLTITPLEVHNGTSKFDLTLDLRETSEGIKGGIEYNTDLFKAETITRILGHFQTFLESIVANPEQRLWDLPILTAAERHQLLVEWNNTQNNYSNNTCIHQLFDAQVEQTPDAIAVVFENQQLTYRELNRRANQLAHHLQALGVRPEVLVGICVERSLEMVVGLLGILKAGGAYVPLDPGYPQERLAYMLSDSQVPVLLTQKQLVVGLPNHQACVVCLDTDWRKISQKSEENPVCGVKPENLAYVIYTSGSTGKPKGVQIIHRGVVNFLNSMSSQPGLTTQDILLAITSLSFDIAALELFLPISMGARIVLVSREVASDGSQLLARLTSSGATVMQGTPATWCMLLAAGSKDSYPLKILCGGEALPRELASQLLERGSSLWNLYGPTETTIWSTAYKVNASRLVTRIENAPECIGRPIANTQVYILDQHLQPVPIGVPGELYIGGDGLARGYLNRPELTAEKFISNPFSDEPGSHLYKTGDLARYLPDGNIEFLGRIDNQVKIRGFRIELGEIEAVLTQHSEVQQAVVIVREDEHGNKHLVAYVVPNNQFLIPSPESQIPSQLCHFLKQKLPDYMIPSAYILLDTLLLTPNGKIDRCALPEPDPLRLNLESAFVAPSTSVEQQIADIWTQFLKLDTVGIHDNFFELGGHSLLATQIISRLRQAFGRELPLKILFEAPTVSELSDRIETIRWASLHNANTTTHFNLPPILPAPRKKDFPLSFGQQRLWFLNQLDPNSSAYNMAAAYRLTGHLSIKALEQSLNKIVRRHEVFRTTFPSIDGQPSQVIATNIALTLPRTDLRENPETEREALAQQIATEEAQQPFELASGPLFRAKLLRLTEVEYVLLLNMHHIISDGWSFDVFFRELAALYEAFSTGKASPLPELPIQYADFAHWQREWLQGKVLESQLNYWKQQLGGSLPILQLPTDYPRPPVQTYPGAYQSLELSLDLIEALKTLSQQEGVTLFMTLLAAFQTLLHRYSEQEDIIVGTPIAGRNQVATEGLIGFFVNSLAIRTNLLGNPSFQQLLSQVREVTLGAYNHQDLPLEKLIEELNPERDLSRSPLFQVMFAFQNTPSQPRELLGLTITPLEVHSGTSKFDLTLDLRETSEGIKGGIEYNTDLFKAATITRMLGHFQVLLEGIVANPEQRLWDLLLLTPAEQHQLLVEWNNTQTDYPNNTCIHQLFEAQVEKTPNAVAVVFDNQQLTYRQLNRRANQLAYHLGQLGVKPEVLVGICLERSPLMLAALLAILKAGGAYVPFDPTYPIERLAFMVADSQISLLLTTENIVQNSLSASGKTSPNTIDNNQQSPINPEQLTVICLDKTWETINRENPENPKSNVNSSNLAYILYTSGSTGNPKGVAIEHRSTVNLINWAQTVFNPEQLAGVLASTSICFDLSVFELFVPLCCGGKVILAENALHLLTLKAAKDVTLINTIPSAIAELLRAKAIPEGVQTVNLAGEPLSQQLVNQLDQQETIQEVFNLYGPSEATTYSTFTLWVPRSGETEKASHSPSIGRPITNTQIYILDFHQKPVPIGVPGELHIGGAGLARGYLNRPELTQEKFILNPFKNPNSKIQNPKLYKTGDLARYLPDGNIEFLGRLDNQVKIRGFRIELGEVESTLSQHPAVRKTTVIAREDIPGDKGLVVYIVLNDPSSIQNPSAIAATQSKPKIQNQLRPFLQQKLPDYMIPSAFVLLETLPLTPNGKVDRRALPVPDQTKLEPEGTFVAPRDELELQLTKIWEKVLGIQPIGVRDNFFDLGGHSLLAVRLFAQIEKAFKKNLPLSVLF